MSREAELFEELSKELLSKLGYHIVKEDFIIQNAEGAEAVDLCIDFTDDLFLQPEYSPKGITFVECKEVLGNNVKPLNDLEKSKELINAHKDDLACLIMEPVISGLGYLPLEQNFLQFTRDITNELNIVLIYDEIQSYRLAPGGAQEIFGITPDMTSLGKIIGGGLPVGAFGGKEEIMETLNPSSNNYKLSHAGTFNGNPLTMEAGAAVMSTLTKDKYTS